MGYGEDVHAAHRAVGAGVRVWADICTHKKTTVSARPQRCIRTYVLYYVQGSDVMDAIAGARGCAAQAQLVQQVGLEEARWVGMRSQHV